MLTILGHIVGRSRIVASSHIASIARYVIRVCYIVSIVVYYAPVASVYFYRFTGILAVFTLAHFVRLLHPTCQFTDEHQN